MHYLAQDLAAQTSKLCILVQMNLRIYTLFPNPIVIIKLFNSTTQFCMPLIMWHFSPKFSVTGRALSMAMTNIWGDQFRKKMSLFWLLAIGFPSSVHDQLVLLLWLGGVCSSRSKSQSKTKPLNLPHGQEAKREWRERTTIIIPFKGHSLNNVKTYC